MKAIAEFERIYQAWSTYVFWCLDAPYTALVCKPFWTWVAIISASLGAIGILWFIWKYIDYKLKYHAAIMAELERERVADYQVMAAARWTGNDPVSGSATEDEMVDRIRESLEKRKLGSDKPSNDLPSIDFTPDAGGGGRMLYHARNNNAHDYSNHIRPSSARTQLLALCYILIPSPSKARSFWTLCRARDAL